MNIGIDISQTVYEGTGVARFTKSLVMNMVTSPRAKNHVFYLFFSSLNHKLPGDMQMLVDKYHF